MEGANGDGWHLPSENRRGRVCKRQKAMGYIFFKGRHSPSNKPTFVVVVVVAKASLCVSSASARLIGNVGVSIY